MKIIRAATKKGQITLPSEFRKQANTKYYSMEIEEGKIIIEPVYSEDEVIFNAERDNNGESVPVGEFLTSLQSAIAKR